MWEHWPRSRILLMFCVLFTEVLSPDGSTLPLPNWAKRGKVSCVKERSRVWAYSPEMLRKWRPGLCCPLSAGGKVSGSALWICHHQPDQSRPPQKHREEPPPGSKWWVASPGSQGQRHYLNIPSIHRVGKCALGTEPERLVVNQTWAGLQSRKGSQVNG